MEFHWPTAVLTGSVLLLLFIIVSVCMYFFNKGQAVPSAHTTFDDTAEHGPVTVNHYLRLHNTRLAPLPDPVAFQHATRDEQANMIIGNHGVVRPDGTVDYPELKHPPGARTESTEAIKNLLPGKIQFTYGRQRESSKPDYHFTKGLRFIKKSGR